jgi:hypothetical protein
VQRFHDRSLHVGNRPASLTQKLRSLAFIDIADVDQVYEILREARANL